MPHTPLLLINGLAAGVDSEAAEVFLKLITSEREQRPEAPHHQLVGALPKPRQIYLEEDFPLNGDPQNVLDRERLERLLSASDAVLDGGNCTELALPQPRRGETRDPFDPRCYGRQGVFLVRHCYLLVAFSNGLDSGKMGGTSQTVAMQRGEMYPLFQQVDEVIAARDPGVVVEITTPRLSDPLPPCPVGQVRYWSENSDCGRIDSNAVTEFKVHDLAALLAWPRIPARPEMPTNRPRPRPWRLSCCVAGRTVMTPPSPGRPITSSVRAGDACAISPSPKTRASARRSVSTPTSAIAPICSRSGADGLFGVGESPSQLRLVIRSGKRCGEARCSMAGVRDALAAVLGEAPAGPAEPGPWRVTASFTGGLVQISNNRESLVIRKAELEAYLRKGKPW
ncbi:hypothetical protein KBZ18_11005 [Synechococcus sp. Cruz-9H2]|uniref:hypothetical protein n=1 Tax=unclassified Synechococcus TaxID=2626047 RepID=UPI0020CC9D62|nr:MULTISPECIES: hypothetical protein [unclassified Synechococcus]MCP9820017.1 hypothetical protein [Synechococcus sp. Cruz-9H2]MCP9844323.1 hypothetical protein [Synechococcus sp. Edmonson 11F2]MCP9856447.1 hypothetical protein [Synechococcus sp. Cruz-9C9]MCP9863778.1 hypothetical protein [Synechococcus sp. Cruz-7E5]MCP9870927.1 hypothetical protein [Synechococcus sp. Cruz-7B9]